MVMSINPSHNGWSRIASGLDVEIQHGVPVRICNTDTTNQPNEQLISEKVHDLTGLTVSVQNWINTSPHEQEWSVCIDIKEFEEVLHRLALSSAAMFVDRFHKPIDHYAVDWDHAEFTYDFNHAIKHCCIPWNMLKKEDYYERYIDIMHKESVRLINEGVSPMVEAE